MTLTWLAGDDAVKKVDQARMAAQLVGVFLSERAGAVPARTWSSSCRRSATS